MANHNSVTERSKTDRPSIKCRNYLLNVILTTNITMSLRIRKSGEILCAAHTEEQEGDTYLNDEIHYYLSVLTGAIIASENHSEDNLWFWNIKEAEEPHYEEIKFWKEQNKIKQ